MGSKKSSVLNAALGVLVVFNVILLIMILFKTNAKKIEISRIPSRNPIIQDVSFIDRTCPEVTAKAIDGTNINLREWVGKVIIIRFSKFFRTDISDLSYLEHIKNTFSEKGLVLLFVNSLGNSDFISINDIYRFSSPITIDHEGDISALFNASSDDIVIVDKNFKIKMKTNARGLPDKAIIYHELLSL